MNAIAGKGRRLIVNADDFGHCTAYNLAIKLAFEKKYITQTTLMVNMPGVDEAVKIARVAGFDDRVGLHLNLTEGFPLTDLIQRCSRFCNQDGSFRREYPFIGLPYRGHERKALKIELSAQIEKYLSFALPLMHCDGHHHIQSRIPLAELIFPLIKAAGFKTFRNCYPYPKYDIDRHWFKMSRYTPVYSMVRKLSGGMSIRAADYFMDFKTCKRCVDRIPNGLVSELMVHPRFDEKGVLVDLGTPMIEVDNFIRESGFMSATYKSM